MWKRLYLYFTSPLGGALRMTNSDGLRDYTENDFTGEHSSGSELRSFLKEMRENSEKALVKG